MRTPRWILIAALALPGTSLAQATLPGTEAGTQAGTQTGTKPGTRPAEPGTRAGTQAGTKPGTPQTGQPTAAEQAENDVILNPIDPIGADAQKEAARNSTVTTPPVGQTGVEGAGNLGQNQNQQDVFGNDLDPFSEPQGIGQPDQFGQPGLMGQPDQFGQTDQFGQPGVFGQTDQIGQPDSTGVGQVDPLNPDVNSRQNNGLQQNELDPLSE
jgi:hypothetical protein